MKAIYKHMSLMCLDLLKVPRSSQLYLIFTENICFSIVSYSFTTMYFQKKLSREMLHLKLIFHCSFKSCQINFVNLTVPLKSKGIFSMFKAAYLKS